MTDNAVSIFVAEDYLAAPLRVDRLKTNKTFIFLEVVSSLLDMKWIGRFVCMLARNEYLIVTMALCFGVLHLKEAVKDTF